MPKACENSLERPWKKYRNGDWGIQYGIIVHDVEERAYGKQNED
jgi:hypothetical protein